MFASPSTREGFGITFAEAVAADCTVIAAAHPESAASEVIGDAGFLVSSTVDGVATALEQAVEGKRPSTAPTTQAQQFDWEAIANQAEQYYRRVINGE